MSYDITATLDETTKSTNWLRNPFGLCQWAEDNVGEPTSNFGERIEKPLYHVCNEWTYGDVDHIDRQMFYEVVVIYDDRIQDLDEGYFYFDLPEFVQFVAPNFDKFEISWLTDVDYIDDKIEIPMEAFMPAERFGLSCRRADTMLGDYQSWMGELVEIAEMIKDGADVSITN